MATPNHTTPKRMRYPSVTYENCNTAENRPESTDQIVQPVELALLLSVGRTI